MGHRANCEMALESNVQLFLKIAAGFAFEMHCLAGNVNAWRGWFKEFWALGTQSPVIFRPCDAPHPGLGRTVSNSLDSLVGLQRILDLETGEREPG